MDPRDSALAHAIVDGAITRWLTLDYLISGLSGRQLRDQEPRMQSGSPWWRDPALVDGSDSATRGYR